jgi:hypothetical protein
MKSLEHWFRSYAAQWPQRQRERKLRAAAGAAHVFITICDHFEPYHHATPEQALERTVRWRDQYPQQTRAFRDSSGRTPRHTFFYPIEQYDETVVTQLAQLCRATGCEVEFHLHHHNDTAEGLRKALRVGIETFSGHGCLGRDAHGQARFGFIHGNWCLANSFPGGLYCGVADELSILREMGCFADLTFPSAPSPTQPTGLNSLGYATCSGHPSALSRLERCAVEATQGARLNEKQLLLIQGPLGLNKRWRKWGLVPRIENGDLTVKNPPTANRLQVWRDICPTVEGQPGWQFVKLHTHGGPETNADMFLGQAMVDFHQSVAAEIAAGSCQIHYVTAREMTNLIHAAEDGAMGDPRPWLDHVVRRPEASALGL